MKQINSTKINEYQTKEANGRCKTCVEMILGACVTNVTELIQCG